MRYMFRVRPAQGGPPVGPVLNANDGSCSEEHGMRMTGSRKPASLGETVMSPEQNPDLTSNEPSAVPTALEHARLHLEVVDDGVAIGLPAPTGVAWRALDIDIRWTGLPRIRIGLAGEGEVTVPRLSSTVSPISMLPAGPPEAGSPEVQNTGSRCEVDGCYEPARPRIGTFGPAPRFCRAHKTKEARSKATSVNPDSKVERVKATSKSRPRKMKLQASAVRRWRLINGRKVAVRK